MPLNSAQLIATGQLDGFRNRIINGAMSIFQRNAAATVDSAYSVDRWKLGITSTGAVSVTQSTDAPPNFNYSLFCDVTSADTSIGAGEYVSLYQVIEGTNVVDLAWGTANAQSITISFWVKATGITAPQTYCVSVRNNASNRSYVANYTVNAAATWEKKTVTIPGDTSGTWLVDNGAGIFLFFTFAAGTSIQTTANTWAAGNFIGTSSIGNLLSSATQEVRISGVQVEKGSTATDFDFRSFAQELRLCQRYFELGPCMVITNKQTTSAGKLNAAYQVTKRAAATIATVTNTNYLEQSNAATFASGSNGALGTVTFTLYTNGCNNNGFALDYTQSSVGASSPTGFSQVWSHISQPFWSASAEL